MPVAAFLRMFAVRRFLLIAIAASACGIMFADDAESMSDRALKDIITRQQSLLADAAKQGDNLDKEAFQTQVESICHEYEALLRANPKFAAAYADYGYLLSKIGMRKEASAILVKANQLDPDIPMVKNQLGNYLAEDGRPLEAVNYYLAAIKLEPNEPLYHYQLGTLLHEARDDFLKSGEWKADGLDYATFQAFKRAAELAPDRFEFVYRYGEAFYDAKNPDWAEALKVWQGLEAKAPTPIERQTMVLHEANVNIQWKRPEQAKILLATVTQPELQAQKQKLVAELDQPEKH